MVSLALAAAQVVIAAQVDVVAFQVQVPAVVTAALHRAENLALPVVAVAVPVQRGNALIVPQSAGIAGVEAAQAVAAIVDAVV